jgi:hypothetical protein
MERCGVPDKIGSFVLPRGYSFEGIERSLGMQAAAARAAA